MIFIKIYRDIEGRVYIRILNDIYWDWIYVKEMFLTDRPNRERTQTLRNFVCLKYSSREKERQINWEGKTDKECVRDGVSDKDKK